ncbi:hypothetical protein KKG31_03520 [Patescibacteria group bacterium]|nr:hypothetical protein [Patescibacteria group bacterium]MBU1758216.1 hypothetical protein [Patescibacteria group bacterium]
MKEYFDEHTIVVIDHHPGKCPVHALMIKDEKCMSSAELIFENASKWWPKYFDIQIATYLYM